MDEKFTPILRQKIESKEDALRAIKYISFGLFIMAGIQVFVGQESGPEIFVEAIIYVLLAGWLLKWKSRAAATFLLLVGVIYFLLIVLAFIDQSGPRVNVILGVVVLWAATKAVEATFKFHGKFANSDT